MIARGSPEMYFKLKARINRSRPANSATGLLRRVHAPVRLVPLGKPTFPDRQQDLQNAAGFSLASECDGSVSFPTG